MPFTFRQLEVFVEAAKDGNFRKTADRIGISQPSVSSQILALEKSLGQVLFDRERGRPARLSREGEALLEKALFMLKEGRALGYGDQLAEGSVVLRVVFGPYLLDQFVRPALPAFYEACPDVALQILGPTSPRQMLAMVRARELDLAFYTGAPPAAEDAELEVIGRVRCSVFASPELAARFAADPCAISELPFVLTPAGSPVTVGILRALAAVGVDPRTIVARSQFPDVLAQMAIAGKGLAVLYDEQVAGEVNDGRLVRVPLDVQDDYRVMIRGPAAQLPGAASAVAFFRQRLLERL